MKQFKLDLFEGNLDQDLDLVCGVDGCQFYLKALDSSDVATEDHKIRSRHDESKVGDD
ncbi:hypothetical protein ABPS01_04210 [Streptococcus sp. ZJ151]|uniref:hypothetical protein n=1 Tax=Streptococcus jiangjianxini TaxID=3161189 RepID=UPI0032EF9911